MSPILVILAPLKQMNCYLQRSAPELKAQLTILNDQLNLRCAVYLRTYETYICPTLSFGLHLYQLRISKTKVTLGERATDSYYLHMDLQEQDQNDQLITPAFSSVPDRAPQEMNTYRTHAHGQDFGWVSNQGRGLQNVSPEEIGC